MGKQKAPMYDQYASLGKNSHYGRIYEDTIKSQPYKNLTLAEKNLYTICRVQLQSLNAKACLYKHCLEEGITYNEECDFVLPAKHMDEYGLERSNTSKLLNRLIKKGFVIQQIKHCLFRHIKTGLL